MALAQISAARCWWRACPTGRDHRTDPLRDTQQISRYRPASHTILPLEHHTRWPLTRENHAPRLPSTRPLLTAVLPIASASGLCPMVNFTRHNEDREVKQGECEHLCHQSPHSRSSRRRLQAPPSGVYAIAVPRFPPRLPDSAPTGKC